MFTISTTKGKKLTLRMTPMTTVVYKRNFGTSLMTDFFKMTNVDGEVDHIDEVVLYQLIYAMNVTGFPGTPTFDEWMEDAWIDFSDEEMLYNLIYSITESLFPKQLPNISKKKGKKKVKN